MGFSAILSQARCATYIRSQLEKSDMPVGSPNHSNRSRTLALTTPVLSHVVYSWSHLGTKTMMTNSRHRAPDRSKYFRDILPTNTRPARATIHARIAERESVVR